MISQQSCFKKAFRYKRGIAKNGPSSQRSGFFFFLSSLHYVLLQMLVLISLLGGSYNKPHFSAASTILCRSYITFPNNKDYLYICTFEGEGGSVFVTLKYNTFEVFMDDQTKQ